MESAIPRGENHSAVVHMELRLDGQVVPIAQMGPDYIVVEQPFDHSPAEADVLLRIDESESVWRVWLVEGISAKRQKTMIEAVA
jgi:hypothetical protein